jgi:hypothetical protein
MTSGAAGEIFYNNTILTETAAGSSANAHWRNNLILGENSAPAIFSVNTYTNYSSSDYNGFRVNPGADVSFQWTSPPSNIAAVTWQPSAAPRRGEGGGWSAVAVAEGRGGELVAGSAAVRDARQYCGRPVGRARVAVDYDIFVNVRNSRKDRRNVRNTARLRFQPQAGRSDIDRGVALANIWTGFDQARLSAPAVARRPTGQR